MKILVISRTPWNNANSFGNTFSNLFEGMENVEIYNIACRHGANNNDVVKKAIQCTDKAVLKSIYKPKFDPFFETQCINEKINQEISENARKNRKTFSFVIRDLIWKLGRWKKSKTLKNFLSDIKPDIIYIPIYASKYMCDFQNFIVNKLKVPVVGHISDDVYGYPPKSSLLAKWYRFSLRKKLRKLIKKCEYLEVFAENMKESYTNIFNKECYLIGKGVKKEQIQQIKIQEQMQSPLHFVYTGNIGGDRYRSLGEIGDSISKTFNSGDAVLDIYSTTPLNKEMEKLFNESGSIKFHGGIDRQKVDEVQRNADFLVHVEGFSKSAIFSAKMSFSTKIIDYLLMGKMLLAYGPEEVNSIQVIKNNQIGLCATSQTELNKLMEAVYEKRINFQDIGQKTREYLVKYRDINLIQEGIYQRMQELT